MGSTGHRVVRSGKRVKVWMRNGFSFIAKFKEKKANWMYFWDHEPVGTGQVKTISIWKKGTNL